MAEWMICDQCGFGQAKESPLVNPRTGQPWLARILRRPNHTDVIQHTCSQECLDLLPLPDNMFNGTATGYQSQGEWNEHADT